MLIIEIIFKVVVLSMDIFLFLIFMGILKYYCQTKKNDHVKQKNIPKYKSLNESLDHKKGEILE